MSIYLKQEPYLVLLTEDFYQLYVPSINLQLPDPYQKINKIVQ